MMTNVRGGCGRRSILDLAGTLLLTAALLATSSPAQELGPPQSVTLSIYDLGFGLATETRRATLAAGESSLSARQLPARLDPASVTLLPVGAAGGLTVLEQRFEFDLRDRGAMLRRFLGREVSVQTGQGGASGRLSSFERAASGDPVALVIEEAAGLRAWDVAQIQSVAFPKAREVAYAEPTVLWKLQATQEGPQNLRLSYLAHGLDWFANHEVMLQPGGTEALLTTRIGVRNETGGRFENARVRLITTEKGRRQPILPGPGAQEAPALRYLYGMSEPAFERAVAGYAPVAVYQLPGALTVDDGGLRFSELVNAQKIPVRKFHVYDGVRFDRFQRNRRNDWNYGTEFHTDVDLHLEFANTREAGLGLDLPEGSLRLYQVRDEGSVDLLGEDFLDHSVDGATAHLRVGPARGLRGERERTGYAEVKPLHEYEESFEIRLENQSDEDVEVRVVEHLYRWNVFEIVRADTEYQATGTQTIEFPASLKPGGKRAIHYTVRYTW